MYLFSLRVKEQEHDVSLRGKERKGKMEGERERENANIQGFCSMVIFTTSYVITLIRLIIFYVTVCVFFGATPSELPPPKKKKLGNSFCHSVPKYHHIVTFCMAPPSAFLAIQRRPDPTRDNNGAERIHPSIHPSIHHARSLARSLARQKEFFLSSLHPPPHATTAVFIPKSVYHNISPFLR